MKNPDPDFVISNAVSAARKVIEQHERLQLSERDSQHVLKLLEEPPLPNAKLTAAAVSLPKQP